MRKNGESFRRFLAGTVVLFPIFLVAPAVLAEPNTIMIHNDTGSLQSKRPVSVSRSFKAGEIPGHAQALVNGAPVLTQCDEKGRWENGSLKFAVVSFVADIPAGGEVTVEFINQGTGHNDDTPGYASGGYLTAADLASDAVLDAFNFDGTIELSGGRTGVLSARDMLKAGHHRYWLRGPIVTAVIIEDRTPSLSYDNARSVYPLHPIFEAWFYHPAENPGFRKADMGYTLENVWASGNASLSAEKVTYNLTLTKDKARTKIADPDITPSGSAYTVPNFMHIARSRWHRRYWINNAPAELRIDHNLKYLVTTRAIPNYDTGFSLENGWYAAVKDQWQSAVKTLDGRTLAGSPSTGIGNYPKILNDGGWAQFIGPLNTWDVVTLYGFGTVDSQRLQAVSLGNSDLAGRMPIHYRERDAAPGNGRFFDAREGASIGTVNPFGRIVSVNARKEVSFIDLSANCNGSGDDLDRIRYTEGGNPDTDGWDQLDASHIPDTAYLPYLISGRYHYLEELQMWAAYWIGRYTGCYNTDPDYLYLRQGDSGYIQDSQPRGDGWAFRTVAYAAFITPEGTPEKDYLEDKLKNTVAMWEGMHGVPNSDPSRANHYAHGTNRKNVDSAGGVSPLGLWTHHGGLDTPSFAHPELVQYPTSPWMENFIGYALGIARDFGYKTDNLLKFMAGNRFNILLNPRVSPYLIAAYHFVGTLSATEKWVQTWEEAMNIQTVPSTWWMDSVMDHGRTLIARTMVSFLTPYTVDGYSGAAAWSVLENHPLVARFGSWSGSMSNSGSPKWAILPRADATDGSGGVPGDPATPARSRRLRIR
jgi:hypothetical protein